MLGHTRCCLALPLACPLAAPQQVPPPPLEAEGGAAASLLSWLATPLPLRTPAAAALLPLPALLAAIASSVYAAASTLANALKASRIGR